MKTQAAILKQSPSWLQYDKDYSANRAFNTNQWQHRITGKIHHTIGFTAWIQMSHSLLSHRTGVDPPDVLLLKLGNPFPNTPLFHPACSIQACRQPLVSPAFMHSQIACVLHCTVANSLICLAPEAEGLDDLYGTPFHFFGPWLVQVAIDNRPAQNVCIKAPGCADLARLYCSRCTACAVCALRYSRCCPDCTARQSQPPGLYCRSA